ncbi:MAG TPA: hypothetical protein VMF11_03855 [Candidatus Baltobacteraceae bacterium]|nr:hypothetical protein [Candidatus Baltobacteraceae bacterium]
MSARIVCVVLALSLLASVAPAAARDRNISDLSTSALIGPIDSTQALQDDFVRNSRLLAAAGNDVGLSPEEYREMREAIAAGKARYVTIPRHIDVMSGDYDGRVFVVHDIRIPAGVHGWEVDLHEPGETVSVYLPNRCGNISVVRHRAEVLAVAPVHHAPPPMVYAAPPIFETPAPIAAVVPPMTTPSLDVTLAPAAAPVTHHLGMLPLLLGAVVAGFLIAGGHGVGVRSGPPPPAPAPIATATPAPVVGCPSARRRRT